MKRSATVLSGWVMAAAFAAASGESAAADGSVGERGDARAASEYPSVSAVLEALRADPSARFESQDGWTIVASREDGKPVLWSFTPAGHPAHPAVVKRAALEEKGTGYVELTTLCEAPEEACFALLDRFRQIDQQLADSQRARRATLDVGISLNEHDRVHVSRLVVEEGKAAEIRMDDLMKVVIMPSFDALRGVLLWTAVYGFDGRDYRLLTSPALAAPGAGSAELRVAGYSGDTFGFSFSSLVDTP